MSEETKTKIFFTTVFIIGASILALIHYVFPGGIWIDVWPR